MSTPRGKPTRPPPSLTTPAATKNFSRFKTTMVAELYSQFNRTVFDNKVPERASEREREMKLHSCNKQLPADMEIIWNKKLRTTAGYCCYLGALGARNARIELSTKVVDNYGTLYIVCANHAAQCCICPPCRSYSRHTGS